MTEPIKEGLKQLLSEAQELAGRGGPEGAAVRPPDDRSPLRERAPCVR